MHHYFFETCTIIDVYTTPLRDLGEDFPQRFKKKKGLMTAEQSQLYQSKTFIVHKIFIFIVKTNHTLLIN